MASNYLQRTGYRLPTEAEWEFACRAGSETGFSFGEADDLLAKYAWYNGNSSNHSQSVGTLCPNEYGLFDMHGNAWEWTQSLYKEVGQTEGGMIRDDKDDNTDISNHDARVLRGGSFGYLASNARSAYRYGLGPTYRLDDFGLRPTRTFVP
jgi:formylglycine-generating enzyme required for sulfatase activity